MKSLQLLACGIAFGACALAQAAEPGTPPGERAPSVQITHSSNDPAVTQGLSTDRIAAQASYMFDELDSSRRGALSAGDLPATYALKQQFTEFDIDGDGYIGLAEFQAWFADAHYERRGELWYPRLAAATPDAQRLGAVDADDIDTTDNDRD